MPAERQSGQLHACARAGRWAPSVQVNLQAKASRDPATSTGSPPAPSNPLLSPQGLPALVPWGQAPSRWSSQHHRLTWQQRSGQRVSDRPSHTETGRAHETLRAWARSPQHVLWVMGSDVALRTSRSAYYDEYASVRQ